MYRILHEQQKEPAECMAYPSMTSSVILAGVHVEAWEDMRLNEQQLGRGYWLWRACMPGWEPWIFILSSSDKDYIEGFSWKEIRF